MCKPIVEDQNQYLHRKSRLGFLLAPLYHDSQQFCVLLCTAKSKLTGF